MQIYFENYSKNTAFAEKIVIIGNQKRAAYVRMAIGLRGLERTCPLWRARERAPSAP